MEKKIRSFRFDEDVMKKLDKIQSYHQRLIDKTADFAKVDTINLNRTMIVKGLIEQEYFEMVQEGLIKE